MHENGMTFAGWVVYDPIAPMAGVQRNACPYEALCYAGYALVPNKDSFALAMTLCRLKIATLYRSYKTSGEPVYILTDDRELTQEEQGIILEIHEIAPA